MNFFLFTSGIYQVKSKNFGKRSTYFGISVKFRVEQVVLSILYFTILPVQFILYFKLILPKNYFRFLPGFRYTFTSQKLKVTAHYYCLSLKKKIKMVARKLRKKS